MPPARAPDAARLDGRDDRPMLVLHERGDLALSAPVVEQVLVRGALRREHPAAEIDDALDRRIVDPFVFGLDVQHGLTVFDVRVVSREHTNSIDALASISA